MRPSIRLIALDLDGTLLDSHKLISSGNAEALRDAAERGIFIVPCTGRSLDCVPAAVTALPFVRYIICSGGGAAFDREQNHRLLRHPLDPAIALDILGATAALGQMGECYTDREAITDARQLDSIRRLIKLRDFAWLNRHPVPDLRGWVEAHPEETVKLNLMFTQDEPRVQMQKKLAARDDILLTAASSINLEVNAIGHGKGDTLLELAALLGVPRESVMACGDQLNDRNMLEKAGFSVAMGNSVDELRRCCDAVTGTNDEDGVAAAIRRFVLC